MDGMVSFVEALLDGQNQCFLGSVDEIGVPHIRAMLAPRRREGIGTIYFSTNTSSSKVRHYRQNGKASVYVCDPAAFQGALLTGIMEVLEEPGHKRMLWRAGDERYYPKGVTDPDYCVLRFTAVSGRCYSNFRTTEFGVPG